LDSPITQSFVGILFTDEFEVLADDAEAVGAEAAGAAVDTSFVGCGVFCGALLQPASKVTAIARVIAKAISFLVMFFSSSFYFDPGFSQAFA